VNFGVEKMSLDDGIEIQTVEVDAPAESAPVEAAESTVDATTQDKDKLNTLRSNLSRHDSAEGETVGSGMLAMHMDRGLQKQAQADKKKARENKSFNSMMSRMDAMQRQIQAQIDYHNKEIAKHRKAITNARSALDYFEANGEFEQNADGSFKDAETERNFKAYEEKFGKVDRNDPAALEAAMLASIAWHENAAIAHQTAIDGLNEQANNIRGAYETGDPQILEDALDQSSIDELYQAGTIDQNLTVTTYGELDDRVSLGEEVSTDASLDDEAKLNSAFSFLAEGDSFGQSAQAMQMTNNFNAAVDGQMIAATPQEPENQHQQNDTSVDLPNGMMTS
jgi:hypothetical protein